MLQLLGDSKVFSQCLANGSFAAFNFSKLIRFIYLGFPGSGKCDHAVELTSQGLEWIDRIKPNPSLGLENRMEQPTVLPGSWDPLG